MSDRCVVIDGALVRVSGKFGTAEGSADMNAMRAILSGAREAFEDRAERLGRMDCHNRRCDYQEPHKHGVACGPRCACGLGMQANLSEIPTHSTEEDGRG